MSYKKDLFKMVERMGWTVEERTSSGHWKLTRDGCRCVIASSSPTNQHQVLKSVARDMRRQEAEACLV